MFKLPKISLLEFLFFKALREPGRFYKMSSLLTLTSCVSQTQYDFGLWQPLLMQSESLNLQFTNYFQYKHFHQVKKIYQND